jgi:LysR family transcriptional regulator, glycine cleavage system transcriptional activator
MYGARPSVSMTGEGLLHGPILNHASMLIDAAIDGQGIALARTALAAADLINGRLVRPFEITLALKNTYWIVCPRATSALPKIIAFRDWLLAEAAADAQQLDRSCINRASARVESQSAGGVRIDGSTHGDPGSRDSGAINSLGRPHAQYETL